MKPEPFLHQTECYERFKDAQILALLADMGTGKSRMAIDIVERRYKRQENDRLVVIAPVDVGPQWKTEQLVEHLEIPFQAYVYRSGGLVKDKNEEAKFFIDCKQNKDLQVYIINFEAFVRGRGNDLVRLFCRTSKKPPMFIVDEASRIKNPDAKSVINIMKTRAEYPESFRAVLTGTPAAKSPVDMWSIFEFLKDGYMGCSYMAFKAYHEIEYNMTLKIKKKLVTTRTSIDKQTYVKIKKWINNNAKNDENAAYIRKKYGLSAEDFRIIANNESFVRFKHVDKLQAKIAPDTFSVSKKDCLDLPDKIYKELVFEMNSEQKKQIKQLAEYSATYYRGETLTVSTKALLGMRVLQICGGNLPINTPKDGVFDTIPIKGPNAKLKYILGDLEEAGDAQCIVWACFVPEIDMLHFELGKKYSIVAMHGDTPKSQRGELVERFKSGDAQVLVANPEVGGYGLNLQCAGVQYWYSRNYRTEARLQAEDRSHRIGTVKSPIYKDLMYNSLLEARVLEVLKEGADLNSAFVTIEMNDLFKLTSTRS